MSNVLGLIGFVFYVASIIGVAAGVTWIVVKWTPSRQKKPKAEGQAGS